MEGAASEIIEVTSGVPHGFVLVALLSLVYITNVSETITSHMRLFADDCVVYREMESLENIMHYNATFREYTYGAKDGK